MANDLNFTVLQGRLVFQPEVNYTPGGAAKARTKIATNRSWQKDGEWQEATSFVPITAWQRTAEQLARFRKGDRVNVHGRLEVEEYTDKEDKRRTFTHVVIQSVTKADIPTDETSGRQVPGESGLEDDIPF